MNYRNAHTEMLISKYQLFYIVLKVAIATKNKTKHFFKYEKMTGTVTQCVVS